MQTDDSMSGLSSAEVAERIASGQQNKPKNNIGKTVGQIVFDNVFNYFNFIFLALTVCMVSVGAFDELLFTLVAVANTLIGIIQEIRVKRKLDKISLLNRSEALVIRGGETVPVPSDELVTDDIVIFSSGSQVYADALILEGSVEADESLITGESKPVRSQTGDELLSGSYIVSGSCKGRLIRVGDDSFASKITAEAKKHKNNRSGIMRSLDRYLKVIGIVILPLAAAMFLRQNSLDGALLRNSMGATVAAVVGMIPQGLYLLVSVALAFGVIKLYKKRTMVNELSSIENLARVDVLCLDKTGTISSGNFEVSEVVVSDNIASDELYTLIRRYIATVGDDNKTSQALKKYFDLTGIDSGKYGSDTVKFDGASVTPFSSERKRSEIALPDGTVYILGAPEFILKREKAAAATAMRADLQVRLSEKDAMSATENSAMSGVISSAASASVPDMLARYFRGFDCEKALLDGMRVLMFAKKAGVSDGSVLPLGIIVLSDEIRPEAAKTIEYFAKQEVMIKVISGDNPTAVAKIASDAGVSGAERCLDMSGFTANKADPDDNEIKDDLSGYTVFGRVKPEEKREIIKNLQRAGHTVAMIGDGVNDVPALKAANCGIAMASGSDAACKAAQIVLLDSDFSALPEIVYEGRRVINNVGRSAALFITKNMFSFIFAAVMLCFAIPFPLFPMQISLYSGIMIGVPSFFLAFEPSFYRSDGRFMQNALIGALPGGIGGSAALLTAAHLGQGMNIPDAQITSMCSFLIGIVGITTLFILCRPLKKKHIAVIAASTLIYYFAYFLLSPIFDTVPLGVPAIKLTALIALCIPLLLTAIYLASKAVIKLFKSLISSRLKAGH